MFNNVKKKETFQSFFVLGEKKAILHCFMEYLWRKRLRITSDDGFGEAAAGRQLSGPQLRDHPFFYVMALRFGPSAAALHPGATAGENEQGPGRGEDARNR